MKTSDVLRIFFLSSLCALQFACSGGENPDGNTGCLKDTDCKGERICDTMTGMCVDPGMKEGCTRNADCIGLQICDPATNMCIDPNPMGMDASVMPDPDATVDDSGIHPDASMMMGTPDGGTSTVAPDAGMLPKGECCDANITAGCLDSAVESCVCNARPECCTATWDATCVALVRSAMCGTCPGTCGDHFCDPASETLANCCEDCGADPADATGMTPVFGDNRCCAALGENICNSPTDCGESGDPNGPQVTSYCGDGLCCAASGESTGNCCQDCPADPADPANDGDCCEAAGENVCNAPGSNCAATVAGDNICGCDETCRNSPSDCGSCGDCCTETLGVPGCSDQTIEACVCAADPGCCSGSWDTYCVERVRTAGCGVCLACGDSICDAPVNTMLPATAVGGSNPGEDSVNCCEDCTMMGSMLGTGLPGDGACNCGEDACSNDPQVVTDCGPPAVGSSCGNGGCETCAPWSEGTASCPQDCGTLCGDGVCNGNETRCGCPVDCPRAGQVVAAPINPADGVCECEENCANAPGDCGGCPACLVMGAPQTGLVAPIDATGYVNAGSQSFELYPGLPAQLEPGCMPVASNSSHELIFVINNTSGTSRMLTAFTTNLASSTDTVLEARSDCNDVASALACSADVGHMNSASRIQFQQTTAPIYLLVDSQGAAALGTFDLVITSP